MTDDELFLLEPISLLHDAAKAAPNGMIAHATTYKNGASGLVFAVYTKDETKAKKLFDALHELTDKFVMDWDAQQKHQEMLEDRPITQDHLGIEA